MCLVKYTDNSWSKSNNYALIVKKKKSMEIRDALPNVGQVRHGPRVKFIALRRKQVGEGKLMKIHECKRERAGNLIF